jgi:hypothetical protein
MKYLSKFIKIYQNIKIYFHNHKEQKRSNIIASKIYEAESLFKNNYWAFIIDHLTGK